MSTESSGGHRLHDAANSVQTTDRFSRAPLWNRPTSAPPGTADSLSRSRIQRLQAWAARLSPGRAATYCALVGILCTLPALWVGFAQDDYAILSVFKGSPGLEPLQTSIWNAFTFSEGDPDANAYRMERGILPWWSASEWKVNLGRPLASLSHWADYVLFGERAVPMHIHSLLLYGALCAAATLFYFRLMPAGWIAAAAGFLFAIDAAHGIPAGWIANRNALLSTLFGVFALLAHHRWRSTAPVDRPWSGWGRYGVFASVCLGLALLSGEAAVGLGAYFFAYSVTLDPLLNAKDTPRQWQRTGDRLRAYGASIALLVPYLAIVVVWRAGYSALGYGASDSWMYVDPLTAPGLFFQYVIIHTPLLLGTLLGLLDTQVWLPMSIELKWAYSAAIWTTILIAGYLLRPMWRSQPILRFWVIACVVSVLPIAGSTLPSDRNLSLPSIASAAVIALFLFYASQRMFGGEKRNVRRSIGTAFAGFFIVSHVALSVPLLLFNAYSVRALQGAIEQMDATVPAGAEIAGQTVIVMNTPLDIAGAGLPIIRSGMKKPSPRNWWWLYAGDNDIVVSRPDERTLRLRPADGFLERPWAQTFRRYEVAPLSAGDTVRLSRMDVVVIEATPDGRPLETEFRFDSELSDPSFTWLAWNDTGYAPFEVPGVGESRKIEGVQPEDLWQLATAFLRPATSK